MEGNVMTTTEKRIKESEATGKIVAFDLSRELKGTAIIKEILTGKKTKDELTERDFEDIYESYESRRYVPLDPEAEKKSRNIYYQQEELNVKRRDNENLKSYRKRKVLQFLAIICKKEENK